MALDASEDSIGKQVKISRINPDNIRSIPVNDLVVNHSRNEFFLTFSLIEPPALLEEKDFQELEEIEAITRAKLTINPQFAESIIKALTSNIEKFKSSEEQDAPTD